MLVTAQQSTDAFTFDETLAAAVYTVNCLVGLGRTSAEKRRAAQKSIRLELKALDVPIIPWLINLAIELAVAAKPVQNDLFVEDSIIPVLPFIQKRCSTKSPVRTKPKRSR